MSRPSATRIRRPHHGLYAALVGLLVVLVSPIRAQSQELTSDEGDTAPTLAPRLPDPTYTLEAIEITGNVTTSRAVVLDVLGLEIGQEVNVETLGVARIRLLATGFFETAQFGFERGSENGRVVVAVTLEERNTVLLSDVYLGSSQRTSFWGGLDVIDGNMFGVGDAARAAFVTSGDQFAFEFGYEDPSLFGSDLSFGITGHFSSGEERGWPVVALPGGDASSVGVSTLRGGGRLSLGYRPMGLLGVYLDLRAESIEASSDAPALLGPLIVDGNSTLATLAASVDLDTRDDPVMPTRGLRGNVRVEGATAEVGDYEFVKLLGQFAAAWEFVPGHVLRFDAVGGGIFGDAPYFDRFFVGDFNDVLPARNLGLNFSSRPAIDLFNTGASQLGYENIVFRGSVEYAIPVFDTLAIDWIYRTEFFLGAGVWGATTPSEDRADVVLGIEPDPGPRDDLPVDLTVDLGFRVETTIGIFGLSFANGFALVPL